MIFRLHRASTLTNHRALRMRLLSAALTAVAVFAICSSASAATLSVHVQNSRGIAVPDADIFFGSDNSADDQADENGNWTGNPGSSVAAAHPSGWPGANAGVSASATRGNVTITLNSLSDIFPGYSPSEPAINPTESAMFAGVNQERANAGAAPLQISGTLTNAADMYATYLNSIDFAGAGDPHNQVSDATTRGDDSGWFGSGYVGEDWGRTDQSQAAMLASWMASPPHRAAILNPSFIGIGVAQVGEHWILDFGATTCGALTCATGSVNGSSTGKRVLPKMSIVAKKSVKRGKKFVTTVKLAAGSGVVRATFKIGKKKVRVTTKRVGNVYRFTALPRVSGRGTLTIRFTGRAGWADKTITQIVKVRK